MFRHGGHKCWCRGQLISVMMEKEGEGQVMCTICVYIYIFIQYILTDMIYILGMHYIKIGVPDMSAQNLPKQNLMQQKLMDFYGVFSHLSAFPGCISGGCPRSRDSTVEGRTEGWVGLVGFCWVLYGFLWLKMEGWGVSCLCKMMTSKIFA